MAQNMGLPLGGGGGVQRVIGGLSPVHVFRFGDMGKPTKRGTPVPLVDRKDQGLKEGRGDLVGWPLHSSQSEHRNTVCRGRPLLLMPVWWVGTNPCPRATPLLPWGL